MGILQLKVFGKGVWGEPFPQKGFPPRKRSADVVTEEFYDTDSVAEAEGSDVVF